ncbi:hypothetical protein AGIG_G22721 [Arapaima gigas]
MAAFEELTEPSSHTAQSHRRPTPQRGPTPCPHPQDHGSDPPLPSGWCSLWSTVWALLKQAGQERVNKARCAGQLPQEDEKQHRRCQRLAHMQSLQKVRRRRMLGLRLRTQTCIQEKAERPGGQQELLLQLKHFHLSSACWLYIES